jgi:uncharacterized membrane-anchored protein
VQKKNVPESIDKWLFFIVMVALGALDLFRSKGVAFGVIEWVLIPVIFGAVGMIAYLVWRTLCRLAGRLIRRDKHVRSFANATFVVLIVLSMLPIGPTLKVDLPQKKALRWP